MERFDNDVTTMMVAIGEILYAIRRRVAGYQVPGTLTDTSTDMIQKIEATFHTPVKGRARYSTQLLSVYVLLVHLYRSTECTLVERLEYLYCKVV
jgi:hypothetical protein